MKLAFSFFPPHAWFSSLREVEPSFELHCAAQLSRHVMETKMSASEAQPALWCRHARDAAWRSWALPLVAGALARANPAAPPPLWQRAVLLAAQVPRRLAAAPHAPPLP